MSTENASTPPAVPALTLRKRLELIPIGPKGITPSSIEDVFRLAQAIAVSQLCPPNFTETDCFVIIANGLEIGLSPFSAIQNTYVVNNRANIFGDIALGLVRASGELEDYRQEYFGTPYQDDFGARVISKRKGMKQALVTEYTVADAKIAETWGKTIQRTKDGRTYEVKTPWVTAPKRMLLFRARGFNLRDNFGDILKGCGVDTDEDSEGLAGFEHAKTAEGRVVEPNFDGNKKGLPAAAAPVTVSPPAPTPSPAKEPEPIPDAKGSPKSPEADGKASGPMAAESAEKAKRGRARTVVPATDLFKPHPVTQAEQAAAAPAIPAAEGVDVGSQRIDYPGPKSPAQTQASAPPEEKKAELTGSAAEVMRRLEADKLDLVEFIKVMELNEFLPAGGKTLADVLEDGLTTALRQWDKIKAHLREIASEQQGPFA